MRRKAFLMFSISSIILLSLFLVFFQSNNASALMSMSDPPEMNSPCWEIASSELKERGTSLTPKLDWDEPAGGYDLSTGDEYYLKYEWQVKRGNVVLESNDDVSAPTTEAEVSIGVLQPSPYDKDDGRPTLEYTWQVRALRYRNNPLLPDPDKSPWGTCTFKTGQMKAPTITSPSHAYSYASLNTKLDWSYVPAAQKYVWEIYKDNRLKYDGEVETDITRIGRQLEEDVLYEWRVMSCPINTSGKIIEDDCSKWSECFNKDDKGNIIEPAVMCWFRTQTTVSAAEFKSRTPELLEPGDGDDKLSLPVTFTWEHVPGSDGYEYTITPRDTSKPIESNVGSEGTDLIKTTEMEHKLVINTIYDWKIRASRVDEDGTGQRIYSKWSDQWRFETGEKITTSDSGDEPSPGDDDEPADFDVPLAPPAITGTEPSSPDAGDIITIRGYNFNPYRFKNKIVFSQDNPEIEEYPDADRVLYFDRYAQEVTDIRLKGVRIPYAFVDGTVIVRVFSEFDENGPDEEGGEKQAWSNKFELTITSPTSLPGDKPKDGKGGYVGFSCGEQEPCEDGVVCIQNPLCADSFTGLIDSIINFIFWVGMAIAPVMLIIGGFYFVTAAGSPERINTAKKIILYTLIGLAIVLLASGLVKVLQSIIGYQV